MKRGVPLAELPLEEFQAAHPALDESVFELLGVRAADRSVHKLRLDESRTSRPSTGAWRERLGDISRVARERGVALFIDDDTMNQQLDNTCWFAVPLTLTCGAHRSATSHKPLRRLLPPGRSCRSGRQHRRQRRLACARNQSQPSVPRSEMPRKEPADYFQAITG